MKVMISLFLDPLSLFFAIKTVVPWPDSCLELPTTFANTLALVPPFLEPLRMKAYFGAKEIKTPLTLYSPRHSFLSGPWMQRSIIFDVYISITKRVSIGRDHACNTATHGSSL
jgi:hypothetical protein